MRPGAAAGGSVLGAPCRRLQRGAPWDSVFQKHATTLRGAADAPVPDSILAPAGRAAFELPELVPAGTVTRMAERRLINRHSRSGRRNSRSTGPTFPGWPHLDLHVLVQGETICCVGLQRDLDSIREAGKTSK